MADSKVARKPSLVSENTLYWEAPPKRGTFIRVQVYERAGILFVEEYGRVKKSVTWVCERAQRANK